MQSNSKYYVCGHCNKELGFKSYREYQRLYFHEGQWLTEQRTAAMALPASVASSPISLSDLASSLRSRSPRDRHNYAAPSEECKSDSDLDDLMFDSSEVKRYHCVHM